MTGVCAYAGADVSVGGGVRARRFRYRNDEGDGRGDEGGEGENPKCFVSADSFFRRVFAGGRCADARGSCVLVPVALRGGDILTQ